MARTGKFVHLCILCIVSLASACSGTPDQQRPKGPFETVELALDGDGENRRYIVFDSKRYISGPYGNKGEIIALINTIKHSSIPATVSNRSVNLPNKAANLTLTVYDYAAPDECGGYEIGWITNILDWEQAELGTEYANAVDVTSRWIDISPRTAIR